MPRTNEARWLRRSKPTADDTHSGESVHVDEDFNRHATTGGSSRSSKRQAA